MDNFDLPRRLAAEALGTGLLVATVVGSGIMAETLTKDVALALLCNTLPTGAILIVLITVLGPISGAHFNPAVTLGFAMAGRFPWRFVPGYWAARDDGWRWVPGFWAPEGQDEMPYTPEPPATLEAGPTQPPPGDDSMYIPGTWLYRDGRQLREARYWSAVQPGARGAYLTALAQVTQELAWHLDQVQALLPAGVQAYRAATGTAATGLAGAQPPTAMLLLTAAMQEVINEGTE